MSPFVFPVLISLLAQTPAPPADLDVPRLLKQIEQRYNTAATLELSFSESYTFQNRPRPAEWGKLFLKKPGKMRWNYQKPAGKVFLSDGKDVFYYSPAANRVEKLRMKETDDLRAPMAFLLGKLDFSRDFERYTVKAEGDAVWITCEPKNADKAPYTQVTFRTSRAARIERLRVIGQDNSILEFEFSSERINAAVPESMFLFQIPAGAEFVDLSASKQ